MPRMLNTLNIHHAKNAGYDIHSLSSAILPDIYISPNSSQPPISLQLPITIPNNHQSLIMQLP